MARLTHERTPWPAMLASALLRGLAPEAFWRLSLKEWRALISPNTDTLSRAAFDALAARHPDEKT